MRHATIRCTVFALLLALGCTAETEPLDAATLCADLAAHEGAEVELDVTLDPSELLRWSSSAALCDEAMPCCNMARYAYLVPGCGEVAVALFADERFPELTCSSPGGTSGTSCAECDTVGARRVIGVRGVLGAETDALLDGGRYRPFEVTEVRLSAE